MILLTLTSTDTLARDAGYQVEKGKIQAVVKEVMESQKDPRGKASKLQALEAYEAYILKHFEYKSDLKAEAMHRLGDLYMQLEVNTHQKKLKEYHDRLGLYLKGRLQDRPPRPRIDHAKSIVIYEEILKQYPNRTANDAVLYQLCHAYSDEGRRHQVVDTLKRLIAQYPKSPFRQEAYFRLGEFSFESQDYKKAVEAYREALQHPDEDFIEIALYKIGWSYFSLADHRRSIDSFISLLDRKAVRTETGQQRLLLYNFSETEGGLLKEVVHTLLLAFDELGGASQMVAYFREKGHRDYEDYLYRTLADLYASQERFAEAVTALETFMKAYPFHEEAPSFMISLIELQTKRKKVNLAVQAKEDLIQTFGAGSPWSKQVSNSARLKIEPTLKETAYELVLHYYAQAQKSKRQEDYEKAIGGSRRFLKDYSKTIEAAKVNFLLAEGLFELKQYEAAANEYEKTAYAYPLHAHTQDAAYNLLLTQEKLPQITIPNMTTAILKFCDRFPQDPRVPDLLLKAAQLASQQGDYATARQFTQKLLNTQPQGPNLYASQKLIATSYFEQKDYAQAAQQLKTLLSNSGRFQIPPKEQEELRTLLASSLYKQAELQKQKGMLQEAALGFLSIHAVAPNTEVAGNALLDGSILLGHLGQDEEAISALRKFLEAYPRSPHLDQAREQLALLYEKQGKYQEAIQLYEKLATSASGGPDPQQAAEWSLAIARLSGKTRDWPRAYRTLLAAAEGLPSNDERALEALHQAAKVKEQMGDPKQAQVLLGKVLERYSQQASPTSRMAYVAAQASFGLGEEQLKQFMEVRLTTPLETSLERKKQLLKEAVDYYSRTVDFKVPEYITAATYKVGLLFEEFRNALLESERPTGLTAEQMEQYNFLLEEQAYPFEEKAVTAYETNVRRAQEGGLYDEWIQKSYQRLAKILPAKYARDEMDEIITKKQLF
jgi:tetratricopeptide (TPR) repeat protein